jgi:hypothetical protein
MQGDTDRSSGQAGPMTRPFFAMTSESNAMTATPLTAPFQQVPQVQLKFKKEPGEIVRTKGNLSYSQGEAGIKNLLSGKFRSTECTVFLTNKRLVATKARRYYPFGPLIWLVRAFFARRIVFSIPLDHLTRIELSPEHANTLTLHTTGGVEFKLVSTAIFTKVPKWVDAISSAVSESIPGAKAERSETAVIFTRA